MSMSVNWGHIYAIPVPTALTQMAVSTVLVGKASRVMGLIAQVNFYYFRVNFISVLT